MLTLLRRLVTLVAALAGAGALAHEPAPAMKAGGEPWRIGIITYASLGLERTVKQELAKLGYEEGVNVVYEAREGLRDMAATQRHARELVAWKPDLIISLMTNAHVAVQEATRETKTPVVLWSADPLETGVIASFRAPGTNFTGFSYEPWVQELQVRFLKLAVPDLECVGHLWNHTYAPAPSTLRNLERAGRLMNVRIVPREALTQEEIRPAIAAFREAGCGGFVVGPHELLNRNGGDIGKWALEDGLAAVSIQDSVVEGGGLASFAPPFERGWTAMAAIIDRILKGEDPAAIPVERKLASPLTVNLGAARALGLQLPPELVDEADVLIE